MARLVAYRWPGNVRELMHVVQRASVLSGGEVIDVADLPEALRESPPAAADELPEGLTLREAVLRLERQMILRALTRAGGNRSEAARQLGIGRPQLYAKLEEHGLGGRSEGEGS